MTNSKKSATHFWQNSIHFWLLDRSSCSVPSKELHGQSNLFTTPLIRSLSLTIELLASEDKFLLIKRPTLTLQNRFWPCHDKAVTTVQAWANFPASRTSRTRRPRRTSPRSHRSSSRRTREASSSKWFKNGPSPASFCLFLFFSDYNLNNTKCK